MLRLTAWPTPTLFWLLTMPGLEMGGYGLVLSVEWKLRGVFGLLTVVKGLINTINTQPSLFCASFVEI